ncbi:hypothetical protein FGO68_gene2572 [Halteria grandinella]|uniref:Uncharacterized protein n=1 Tax=Halteria grandinella TaxID=5974 RepID=A0A8J8NS29_HALGN|nr:hypothetical protein FGO68_gene2572 [Halteria grandinella]
MRNPSASASGMDNTRVIIERKRQPHALPLSPRSPPTVSGTRNPSYTRLKQTYIGTTSNLSSTKRLTSLRSSTGTLPKQPWNNRTAIINSERVASKGSTGRPSKSPTYRVQQSGASTMRKGKDQKSLATFTQDGEFIQFLKGISLYVTEGGQIQCETEGDEPGQLYKNLEFLRQRFQEYKQDKENRRRQKRVQGQQQQASHNQTLDITTTTYVYPKECYDPTVSYFNNETTRIDFDPPSTHQQHHHQASFMHSQNEIYSQMPLKKASYKTDTLNTGTFQSAHKQQHRHSNTSIASTGMSDKQRKQIEFIDEIYNKVVLKKDSETTLPSERKPLSYAMPYNKQPYTHHHTISEDKENNSPFGNLLSDDHKSPFSLDQPKKPLPPLHHELEQLSSNRTPLERPHQLSSHDNSHENSTSNFYLGQAVQLSETLKALNETAQQLRSACQGLSHHFVSNSELSMSYVNTNGSGSVENTYEQSRR